MNTTYIAPTHAPVPVLPRPVLPAVALLVATAALALSMIAVTITKNDISPTAPHPQIVASQSQSAGVPAGRSTRRNLDDCGRPISRDTLACK